MNDQDLLRYARQIVLPQVGVEGQETLLDTTMLLIGMGGLGSPGALYLAAAGVGHLIIVDFDQVELSNLQRQVIHHTEDIGRDKVASAEEKIQKINPNTKVTCLNEKLDQAQLEHWAAKADIVLDGSDNFDTRFAVNRACVSTQTPLVSAAVIRFEGQLSVFKGYESNQPCYRCLYGEDGNNDNNCVENGILAPVAGMLGSMQALQAVKTVLNLGEQLLGKLLIVDALSLEFRQLNLAKDPQCPVCSR